MLLLDSNEAACHLTGNIHESNLIRTRSHLIGHPCMLFEIKRPVVLQVMYAAFDTCGLPLAAARPHGPCMVGPNCVAIWSATTRSP